MEPEFYLERMHEAASLENYPYEYDAQIIEMISNAREQLEDDELLNDPLEGIRCTAFMVRVFAQTSFSESIAFVATFISHILVYAEIAEGKGYTREAILQVILSEPSEDEEE